MKPRFCATGVLAAVVLLSAQEAQPDEPRAAAATAASDMRGKEPGETRDDNGLKMRFNWCPPGPVTMEIVKQVEVVEPAVPKPNGKPVLPKTYSVERVTPIEASLTRGFWIGKYEVTQSEWKAAMATEPWLGRDATKTGTDYPATFISWKDANEFCDRLTERERKAGRLPADWAYTLPTEAQWERACRAGTDTTYSFGEDVSELEDFAWYADIARNAGEAHPHTVGQKRPNRWGLHDMHGNVWEWCRDWYSDLPGGVDPEVVVKVRPRRAIRGGCWYESTWRCRSGSRLGEDPTARKDAAGFRVTLAAVVPAKADRP
jgi:formylglycine-generating enzyme required for sulfatase activity